MTSVGEAAALLGRALEATQQSATDVRAVSEVVGAALRLLLEAFDGVTQPEAEDAISGLRAADSLLAEVVSLLGHGDESVRRYAAEVLKVDVRKTGGPSHGGAPTPAPRAARADLTRPSRPPDPAAQPGGTPARIQPRDDADTVRGLQRENEAARILAVLGYDIVQRPSVGGARNPDYRIEGRIFDCHAPSTGRARNIHSTITGKVEGEQAFRHVIYLDDSSVDSSQLASQFREYPIPGLEEVLVLKHGRVTRIFP